VLRHGQTAWNLERRIQGHLDEPLDDTGRWQAQALGQALASEDLQAIYSSDLQRAAATAAPLAQRVGLPVCLDAALRERCFGAFEGQLYADIQTLWPEAAQRWRSREVDFCPGGGESLTAFDARCVTAVARLAARHPGQAIAIFAHGGVLDCLYRAATRVGLAAHGSWPLGNASINRLLHSAEGFALVGWNDDAHLLHGAPLDATSAPI
jgi:2,3-bisphosphoglycerate-dependent phosphoglycerate mutase